MDSLKKIILKYQDLIPEDIIKRDLIIEKSNLRKAIVLIGPRRAGKSYQIYSLTKQNKNPVFINFEDNLLVNLNQNHLNNIVDYSKEIFEKNKFSFFFDEIQMIPKWENFIVTLLNEGHNVFITGSNSFMLSKEIATQLRGKSLSYLMLPLSFKEFLRFKKFNYSRNYKYTDEIIKIKKYFNEFMTYGGFPEIVISESLSLKNRLINNYFDTVIYKDLMDKLNLKNKKLIDITTNYIISLFGNTFSISSFEKFLKNKKIPHSFEDLYLILKSLEDIFFSSYVQEYHKSFKKKELSKSKVYLFDNSYIHFFSNESEDLGRILENTVFIELFRRSDKIENKSIFFFKDKKNKECDFVIKEKRRIKFAFQVCYELNEKSRDREINGLLSALNYFDLKEGIILTYEQEDSFEKDGKKIIVKPVWKWLLE